MFDIGRTKSGSPYIFLSGAHFYQCSPEVYQNFTGFQRPRNSDATYIDIEPVSLFFKDFASNLKRCLNFFLMK